MFSYAPIAAADSGIIPTDIPHTLSLGAHVLVYHQQALKKGVVQNADNDGAKYRVLLDGQTTPLWIKDVDIMVQFLFL